MKNLFKRSVFLKLFMVLLAIGWSTSSVKADDYWMKVSIKAVYSDGTNATSWVGVGTNYNNATPSASQYTMTDPVNSSYTSGDITTPQLYVRAAEKNNEAFLGWYLDEECTQLIHKTKEYFVRGADAAGISYYSSSGEAAAHVQTIYGLFEKPINWQNSGATPVDGHYSGKYYIYNVGWEGFVSYNSSQSGMIGTTKAASQALLFTLTNYEFESPATDSTQITTYVEELGADKYFLKNGGSGITTDSVPKCVIHHHSNGICHVEFQMYNKRKGWQAKYWESKSGAVIYTTNDYDEDKELQQWLFVPEQTYLNYSEVRGKKSDGSVTISESPTAQGTAYVSFNVSDLGRADQFNYALPNGDTIDGAWKLGTATRSTNVITIPVIYTAQNIHGNFSTTVTMSSRAETPTSASATATATVNLQPEFTMAVSELDWSYVGEELVETFNVGMEVAASQRTRLQNKLVYSTANVFAQTNAVWTATILDDAAGNFKFANGTHTVSGTYSPELMDVIYAPQTAGTHTANLRVEVSYSDANDNHLSSDPVTVALSGQAQNVPMITMAVDGSEISYANQTHEIGDIVGTNSKEVIVDLFIHDMGDNLSAEWSADAESEHVEDVFVFNADTLNLDKTNHRFVITAHPDTAVKVATPYSATLTIKSAEISVATLTLQYTAKPLLTPDVTWNWEELVEDGTYTNPIITNSDGDWTLEQRDGNGGMTYYPSTKSITTEYMHHESGYTATFELEIQQTDSFAALTDTLTATIVKYIPPVIEINSEEKFLQYVEVVGLVGDKTEWLPENNAMNVKSSKVWFKWSGQSTFAFDFEAPIESSTWSIYEMYEDDTEQKTYEGPFYNGQHHEFPVSPNTYKLRLEGNNELKNVRYFEYDTIIAKDQVADAQAAIFVEEGTSGTFNDGTNKTDIIATFANKREVTISLNAAAQPYFELRAEGKPTGSSLVYNDADGLGVHKMAKDKVFTVAIKEGANIAEAKAAAGKLQVILKDNYTYNSETVILPIALEESYKVMYKANANGVSYKVTYHNDMENPYTVEDEDYKHTVTLLAEANCTATLSNPTPKSGYMFRGWKLNGTLVSCKATYTMVPARNDEVEPVFVPAEEAVYGIDDARFADLDVALSTAGSIADTKPVVVLQKDVTLSEPATHTIPAGVTLLIPYKDGFNALQDDPEITTTATPLAAYRTLTLKEGVNFVCNGTICVSGKIMAAGGGNKSAYTTGECGVINMATGGHIELNNGAHLYCWGYIKGQDMDQGNNTQGTGTVTVNSGAVVHENFELGDWRGGTASSNIYNYKDSRHLFPFQSYALQNVEIPTTYKFGSKLETFMAVNTGFGSIPFAVSMIGSENTLFLLKDAGSVIRKWYDPTSDLTCYELSGTAQLDQLVMNLPFVGDFESGACNLPISNSMHIILKDDLTLSKRLMQQAGSIIEIKSTATINLENELYLYDKDQWKLYIHNYYFRSFNNLTSHKDRGAENEKTGLEDAKLIVDGILNIQNGGKLYTTAGGANVMGNGGGEIHFTQALPAADVLWAVTVKSGKPYIEWENNPVAAANLCNEDGSYTRSIGGATFYNVHGRWFHEEDKDAQSDHTYWFTYMDNGNSGEDVGTNAVYSHDKTGLEKRMKWFNVTPDACANWWTGTDPAAFYNYSMLNDWHQFMTTETQGMYSGSDNKLYQKDGCTWVELDAVDENCLYTFSDGKKALVNGAFIPLTSNGYDPAYHKTDDATKYYICFQGCNWHPATPYTGESKAYTIAAGGDYIWFNNDWLNVLRDEPFFFTEDEQTNVRTYYEYINGEWEIATPYVSVSDAAETRTFYMIKEAFNVASIKKNATITLLRDLPNVSEVLTYTTQNTTCTLDLNGHVLSGNVEKMITVNAPGATFTITDNAAIKSGKISNAANKAVYVQKGTLVVTTGIIESASTYAIDGATTTAITINGGYFAANTQCVHTAGTCSISGGHFNKNAGLASYAAAHKYPFETTDPKYKYEVSDAWTITFKNYDGSTLLTLHLKDGEMPIYTLASPTREGYKFTGWDDPIVAAEADATYTAQFAALVATESCVTLNSNGGKEGLQYVYVTTNQAIGTVPAGTTKEGHTFVGWFDTRAATGGNQLATNTVIGGAVTYYARYSKNSYTLTWNANGGVLSGEYTASGSVAYGATITAPTATFEGHDFLGWNATVASTMPAQNVTYTAQWSVVAKHYLQNLDGTYPETPEVTENVSGAAGEYVTPAVKTYDGFESPAAQTVQIGAVTEVTYEYARRTYTITLDATTNEGTCGTASVNVKHGATIETLPAATKAGRVFEGWFTKATGGDKITTSTVIQRNIGTLYAQFSAATMNVTSTQTISDTREVTDLRITTTGKLTITGNVTATNFILESNGSTASGQFMAGYDKLHATNAYFDLKLNTDARHWRSFGVPWVVSITDNPLVEVDNEGNVVRTLNISRDYEIMYYDGAERAANGPSTNCWKYLRHYNEPGQPVEVMQPGRGYMIAFGSHVNTVRFAKKSGAPIIYTGSVGVTVHQIGAISNPMAYHTTMDAGIGVGQVHDGGEIGHDGYDEVTITDRRFVVGKTVYIDPQSTQSVVINKAEGSVSPVAAAPARRGAKAMYKKYLTLEDYYTVALINANGEERKVYVLPEEDKADQYVAGHDLTKMGMSDRKAQIWVNRYDTKLGLNTTAPINDVAVFPINLYAPSAGEFTISLASQPDEDYTVYLTNNGRVVWNLSDAEYMLDLPAGVNNQYGLRLVKNAPQITTGIDEAVVDAKGETRKVLINNQVYIIRGNNVYSVDGQMVK